MREAQEVIYHQLVDSLIDELKPKGILQEHLVLKIANSLWRYRRVINAETARINRPVTHSLLGTPPRAPASGGFARYQKDPTCRSALGGVPEWTPH